MGTGTGKQRRVLTSQAVRVNQAPSPTEFVTLSTFLGAPCASVSSPVGFDDSEITCTHSKRLIKKKKKKRRRFSPPGDLPRDVLAPCSWFSLRPHPRIRLRLRPGPSPRPSHFANQDLIASQFGLSQTGRGAPGSFWSPATICVALSGGDRNQILPKDAGKLV